MVFHLQPLAHLHSSHVQAGRLLLQHYLTPGGLPSLREGMHCTKHLDQFCCSYIFCHWCRNKPRPNFLEPFGLRGKDESFKQLVDVINTFYSNIYSKDSILQTCPKKAST